MGKIGIVLKPNAPQGKVILEKLIPWLSDRGKKVLMIDPKQQKGIPRVEMIIVLGGDGTLLAVARLISGSPIPILAVNLGHLGFLTEEVASDALYANLTKIFAKGHEKDPRMMLHCTILRGATPARGTKKVKQSTVLNDIVVNKGSLARLIKMEVMVDGQFVTALRGDGLIIASATGSTAYTLSAGGPIVHPSVDAIILTPIAPHVLANRPIVIPATAEIRVILKSDEVGPVVTFDGQDVFPLEANDEVEVCAAKDRLNLIWSPERNYYQVLREKLQWGVGRVG
jgi:NAD+ kinase